MSNLFIDQLVARFEATPGAALAFRGETTSYAALGRMVQALEAELRAAGVAAGGPVALVADYSPTTVAALLALIRIRCIVVPMLAGSQLAEQPQAPLACIPWRLEIDAEGRRTLRALPAEQPLPALFSTLAGRQTPGLVLATSGSTGAPKFVVHDFAALLEKFRTPRPALVTLNFLLFDHWGGLNTLLHGLSNATLVVLPERRTPDHICDLLDTHAVALLPATPTFLNLLLVSQVWRARQFPALRVISYGAEPMPETTLRGLRRAFPGVELRQTYGLIELGVLRAKSRDSDSLWVKLGGAGYALRVVDGMLEIKADAAMLGYLNAPSPLTADGYFMTGDRVEVDGEYFRILGRDSDLINVGGDKVYPAEVEGVLLGCENVLDAVVYGAPHPLLGAIVCAEVQLREAEAPGAARLRLKRDCGRLLAPFKVPVKLSFVAGGLHTERLKRRRSR